MPVGPREHGDQDALLLSARKGDEDAFRALVEAHLAELHAHCYRILSSYHDAEDAVQDALVRAWRALPTFEGRSSLRAWLYKVATNAALDIARRRSRRELPVSHVPPVPTGGAPGAPLVETTWAEPYPDHQVGERGLRLSPEASYDQRESLELAFVVALQTLPASQRAALLLREVLGFSAAEIAEQLSTTVPAVTSALQRARQTLTRRGAVPVQQQALRALGDERARQLVEAFIDALERADPALLVGLLTEDAAWTMPPLPSWYQGPTAIGQFLADFGFNERWRHLPTSANGQLALGCYTVDPATGTWVPSALAVLSVRGERVAEVDYFLTAELLGRWGDDSSIDGAEMFARFGLPATVP
ncbi:MAG TPA: RNA polymerase subunit sigma-70 [Streptosporangiaceae bacterium]|nr:RNA polymerase subunit sigma-70 [Streptosporangiaceae bacterium]